MAESLSDDLLRRMDAYWRAANYLSVGQIYLLDNPLLRRRVGFDNENVVAFLRSLHSRARRNHL